MAGESTSFMKLVTGSQAEGFPLTSHYTHEPPDLDIMFLYGGDWCVRIPSERDVNKTNCHRYKPYLEMAMEDCAPGYCHIYMQGNQALATPTHRCSYLFLKFLNILPNYVTLASPYFVMVICLSFMKYRRWSFAYALLCTLKMWGAFALCSMVFAYLESPSSKLFHQHDEKNILLPLEFLRELSYKVEYLPQIFQGPSHSIFNRDLVPALICLQPFPCIEEYLKRKRSTIWPTPKALAQIAATPGVLVPTGRKRSPMYLIEWRFSFSVQELCLSQEMPSWVKAGYRAFKYTLKPLLQALRVYLNSNVEDVSFYNTSLELLMDRMKFSYTKYKFDLECLDLGLHGKRYNLARRDESCICSYHMKNILLWSLEDSDIWEEPCPLNLKLRLLYKLEVCLRLGSLPQYFNVENNLLENVSTEELALTRACVTEILRDPVAAMSSVAVKYVSPIDAGMPLKPNHLWNRRWYVACWAPNHYLNQCQPIIWLFASLLINVQNFLFSRMIRHFNEGISTWD